MSYSITSRIRFSELDADRKLKLTSLIDYFQDCATFHGEDSGNGLDDMGRRGLAWIIMSWDIRVYDLPTLNEEVTCMTRMCGLHLLSPVRVHALYHPDGTPAAEGYSEWIVLNTQTRHPERIPEDIRNLYPMEEPLPFPPSGRHIRLPQHMEEQGVLPVREDEIDINGHVNNGQYVRMAVAALPADFHTARLQVEYRQEARREDEIHLLTARTDDAFYVVLCSPAGEKFATVCFREDTAC